MLRGVPGDQLPQHTEGRVALRNRFARQREEIICVRRDGAHAGGGADVAGLGCGMDRAQVVAAVGVAEVVDPLTQRVFEDPLAGAHLLGDTRGLDVGQARMADGVGANGKAQVDYLAELSHFMYGELRKAADADAPTEEPTT